MFSKIFIILLLSLLVGCTNQPKEISRNRPFEAVDHQITDKSKSIASSIKVVLYQDKSGSCTETITPQVEVKDIDPLIEHVAEFGRELAVGIMDDRSNKPLERLFLDPPVRDFAEPDSNGNPFLLIKQRQDYQIKSERYAKAMDTYHIRSEPEIRRFRDNVKLMLSKTPDASQTNIHDAIARADLFFCESGTDQASAKQYLVLVSDGQHTVKGVSTVTMKSNAQLILINGSGALGSLSVYPNIKRFEQLQSAIRYIIADASGGD